MPFNGKITVGLKGKMTTAGSSNTIKVFYHTSEAQPANKHIYCMANTRKKDNTAKMLFH